MRYERTYARPDAISNTPYVSNRLEKIGSKEFEEIENNEKKRVLF